MTARCEPPPELRGVDGWHWLQGVGIAEPVIGQWLDEGVWKTSAGLRSAKTAFAMGWRYLSPVATPAEVEELRAERDEALKLQGEVHRLRTGIKLLADTVRSWGWTSNRQESNGELVGRALHDMDAVNRALGASRDTLRARVAEIETELDVLTDAAEMLLGGVGVIRGKDDEYDDIRTHEDRHEDYLREATASARATLSPKPTE